MSKSNVDLGLDCRADVVILGGGAAGLIAAIEAADRGAKVVVFERASELGGSSRLSGGYVGLCETELEAGSREELFTDLIGSHHFDHDEALSRLYVDAAPDMYVRLAELDVRFAATHRFAHMSRPWGHEMPLGKLGGGAQIIDALAAAAQARGAQLMTSAPARRLRRDDHGAVHGVVVEHHGTEHTIEAKRGVLIATGGFTRNPALIKNFGRPGTENISPITAPGSLGDGLLMGMALGAATAYLGPGVAPTGPMEPVTEKGCLVNYSGAILLNVDGLRFTDESAGYLDISWAGLAQPEGMMVQVFDSKILGEYMTTMIGQVLSGWKMYTAETMDALLTEIAADVVFDAATARRSVETYNRSVEDGTGVAFGRRHLIGSDGELVMIEHPPFHAVVTRPGTTHFNGGLRIDTAMHVVDVFGDRIDGLYAAGEVTGGFHGMGYMSATHLGSALIFGRIAGLNLACDAD